MSQILYSGCVEEYSDGFVVNPNFTKTVVKDGRQDAYGDAIKVSIPIINAIYVTVL